MLATKQQVVYRSFLKTDPVIAKLYKSSLENANPLLFPVAKPSRNYFKTLVRSIVSQQISTKAAESVFKKLQSEIRLTPQQVKNVSFERLQSCGLSKQKVSYIQSLADNWTLLKTREFANLPNYEIISRLTSCHGIGIWTAEMFLIFAMARDNVFSIGDLGLRQQVSVSYGVEREDKKAIKEIAESWDPYRTHASLALWHQLDNGPVLL